MDRSLSGPEYDIDPNQTHEDWAKGRCPEVQQRSLARRGATLMEYVVVLSLILVVLVISVQQLCESMDKGFSSVSKTLKEERSSPSRGKPSRGSPSL
jgi:Flp pilus assembly pilin Flp